ncbi:hypothetical protein BDZ94DRAFT_1244525 [Collybia nuda]|uniref:MYND-type domain-containing protein n=1 Tax=Collybia nuda TaxID=64659 RepID=A0A9P5YGE7_9AGAR|nr:hypothetical protein BDZ94DRAFT_1244525 [Collybia nuda]
MQRGFRLHCYFLGPSKVNSLLVILATPKSMSQAAKLFNELPRPSRLNSISNDWYFDVRYVPLEPTPHHMLFLIRPADKFVHAERLPLGVSHDESGIGFFPETAEDAAPEVIDALIYSFVNNFGRTAAGKASAPWKLSTFDPGLAVEVGKIFRQIGVRKDLWKINVARNLDPLAQALCDDFFTTLTRSMGITYFISTPQSIGLSNYRPPPDDFFITGESVSGCGDTNFGKALAYAQDRMNCRSTTNESEDMMRVVQSAIAMFQTKPLAIAQAEADAGDPESALDIAFRLRFGCGCVPNRWLERFYFIKALSPQASPEIRASAHAALIAWYTASVDDFRTRAMHAACHHADQAALLSSVHGKTPPAVLWFLSSVFKDQTKGIPYFSRLYRNLMKAGERRDAEMAQKSSKMELKRLQHPHRYQCAAIGCKVLADTGKMLSRCSGKCDLDKKPSYCSKEFDWPNHKPFCKPGAACSVVDTTPPGSLGASSKKGAIQVNVENGDGSTTVVSSSTLTAAELKEIREAARLHASKRVLSNFHMERYEI